MRATRYWRSNAGTDPGSAREEAVRFARAGMALVVVDARGSGASFGRRPAELAPREIRDYGEVANWIATQPWSNGRVGTFGVSYDGDTAELIASLGNRHITAVAPQFNDYEVYEDLVRPGGLLLSGFIGPWGATTQALDGVPGALCRLAALSGVPCAQYAAQFGEVRPVDGPAGPRQLREAVAQHARNVDPAVAAAGAPNKDDRFGTTTWTAISPAGVPGICRHRTPILVQAGWLDAATANGTLSRFTGRCTTQEVYIGAWSHGGEHDTDPFAPPRQAPSPSLDTQWRQLTTFFTKYVARPGKPSGRRVVHYSTAGERGLRTTTQWPPAGTRTQRWHLGDCRTLKPAASGVSGADRYHVDRTATTGPTSRWDTQLGGGDVVYPDRRREDTKLLAYTSKPLRTAVRLTGRATLRITMSSSTTDGALIAYLEDVAPNGRVTYLTEGVLQLRHRALTKPQPGLLDRLPRTYTRAAARPMPVGRPVTVTLQLLPTSALVRPGHRLRIAVAGHDQGHFAAVPSRGPAPVYTVHRGLNRPNTLDLPATSVNSG